LNRRCHQTRRELVAEFVSQLIGPSGSLALIFGSIYAAFTICDVNASKHARDNYTSWLKTGQYVHLVNFLPSTVLSIFERIFEEHHGSLRCFRRSAYVSLASLIIFFIFSASHSWRAFTDTLLHRDWAVGWTMLIFTILYIRGALYRITVTSIKHVYS